MSARSGSGDPFYRSQAWLAVRRRVLARDGYACTVCGLSVRGKGLSRVDHVLLRKTHPHLQLELSNLRTLCGPCDNARHSEKGRGGVEKPQIGLDGLPDSWR